MDASFRERLIREPRAALTEFGLPLGEDVVVNVHVEEPGSFSIVLPRVLWEGGELSPRGIESGGRRSDGSGGAVRGYV